jgi:hypothetical protein
MQVLQTLTGAAVPSKELTSSIKNLHSKTKDVEFLFAILSHLPKDEDAVGCVAALLLLRCFLDFYPGTH